MRRNAEIWSTASRHIVKIGSLHGAPQSNLVFWQVMQRNSCLTLQEFIPDFSKCQGGRLCANLHLDVFCCTRIWLVGMLWISRFAYCRYNDVPEFKSATTPSNAVIPVDVLAAHRRVWNLAGCTMEMISGPPHSLQTCDFWIWCASGGILAWSCQRRR